MLIDQQPILKGRYFNWCLKISTINQLVTELTEIWKRGFYTQKKRGKPKGVWSRKGLTSNDKIEKRTYYSRECHCGRHPFNQDFRKFRSKTQWIGSAQPEKFRKNLSPPFEVDHFSRSDRSEILVEWIAPVMTFALPLPSILEDILNPVVPGCRAVILVPRARRFLVTWSVTN